MEPDRFGLILGFPRSGTTLLRRLLDAHPQVSCPPETWVTTACARFLQDTVVDGPEIGVRTGLGFLGVAEADIFAELRGLTFRFHERLAQGKRIWAEKSGFDLFHLAELEPLFTGHARFVALVRHPLDTIASNLDLAARLGRFLPEMAPFLARNASPAAALAAAWVDRTEAQLAMLERQGDAACLIRFEDMVADPAETLAPVFTLLGAECPDAAQIAVMMAEQPRLGLGDWKTYASAAITSAPVDRWKQALSRQAVADVVPTLAPLMDRLGYPVPRFTKRPTRAQAIRQFQMASQMAAAAQGRKDDAS